MSIKMVREPSASYIVKSGANYYAESDINLTNSLGLTTQDYYAALENLVYGKINIDNIMYLVSTGDMEMVDNVANYNSVLNTDDFVSIRYAYGNQDGYVIGRGNELSSSTSGASFTINSGRVVLQGVESDIDANGVKLDFDDGISGLRYVTVYYQVNLATNTATIKSMTDTVGYPIVDKGDDLTTVTNGTANLELYHVQIQNGVVGSNEKVVKAVEYINPDTVVKNAQNAENAQDAENAENAQKIQNIDLSNDSAAKFGNYIVEKKVLLFNGSENEVTLSNLIAGDTIEVEYGEQDDSSFLTTSDYFVRMRITNKPAYTYFSDNVSSQYPTTGISMKFGGISYMNNVLKITAQVVTILNGGTVKIWGDDNDSYGLVIKKVYKIIE